MPSAASGAIEDDPPAPGGLEELQASFEAVQEQLFRACNELLPEASWKPAPDGLVQEALHLWGELRAGRRPSDVAEVWSLLLSKAQAEALDRAGVPHPPELIPVTEEQRTFWSRFAAQGGQEQAGLDALSTEWSAAATVVEALHLAAAEAARRAAPAAEIPCGDAAPLVAVVLGPSPAQEYLLGARALEAQLAVLLGALGGRSVRFIFCGPEVPRELHGAQRQCGNVTFEHWRVLWHEWIACGRASPDGGAGGGPASADGLAGGAAQDVDVYVALNAGTSVAEYREPWLRTLRAIAGRGGLVFFTGYTLAEAEDTRRDLLKAAPRAVLLACGQNRTAAMPGPDRVELGVTPASYPGKSNYSRCCARLLPG